jgi:predicted RND superfamily exporter protein
LQYMFNSYTTTLPATMKFVILALTLPLVASFSQVRSRLLKLVVVVVKKFLRQS